MKREKVLVYAEIVNFLKENTFEFPIPTLKFKSLFWVRIVDGSIVVLTVQNKKYVISEATYNRFLERRITKNYQFFNRKEQYIISILRELLSLNLITSCGIFFKKYSPIDWNKSTSNLKHTSCFIVNNKDPIGVFNDILIKLLKKLSVNLNDKEVKAFILNQIRELGCATALVVLKEFLSNIVKCAFVDITGVAIEGVILILIVKKIMELLHKELREQIGCQS